MLSSFLFDYFLLLNLHYSTYILICFFFRHCCEIFANLWKIIQKLIRQDKDKKYTNFRNALELVFNFEEFLIDVK